jgi:hypothetical protein
MIGVVLVYMFYFLFTFFVFNKGEAPEAPVNIIQIRSRLQRAIHILGMYDNTPENPQ